MRDILITILVFAGLPMIMLRPHIGIYFWSWIAYMNPHRLSFGFAYNMPFAAMIGGTLLMSFLFNAKERRPIPWNPLTITLVCWVIWMNVTTLFAVETDAAAWQWNKVMKIQLINFITMMLIFGRDRIIPFLWVVALSVGYFGVKGGIHTVMTGGGGRVWGPPDSDLYDTNDLAVGLLVVLPLFLYLRGQTNKRFAKWIALFFAAFCLFSIVGSYSRGAMVASFFVGFMFWLNSKNKILVVFPLILIFTVVPLVMPPEYFERMNTVTQAADEDGVQDGSALGRVNAWLFASNLTMDRPIVGGGYNAFRPRQFYTWAPDPEAFHDAHSIWFEVLGEQGYPGLVMFMLLQMFSWYMAGYIMRNGKRYADLQWASELGRVLRISFVAYWIGGSFLGMGYWDLIYHLMAVIAVTYNQVRERVLKEIAEEERRRLNKLRGIVDDEPETPGGANAAPEPGPPPKKRGKQRPRHTQIDTPDATNPPIPPPQVATARANQAVEAKKPRRSRPLPPGARPRPFGTR